MGKPIIGTGLYRSTRKEIRILIQNKMIVEINRHIKRKTEIFANKNMLADKPQMLR